MGTSKIIDALAGIDKAINSSSQALDQLNEKALRGGLGFDALINSLESSVSVVGDLTTNLGSLGDAMGLSLGTGALTSGMTALSDSLNLVMGGASGVAKIFHGVGKAIDSVTGFSRGLNKTLYESVSKFNGSFSAAKQFSDYIIRSSQDFATAEMGFISPSDRIAAVKGLERAGVPLAHMSDLVKSAAGEMDLLNTAFLHSKALGLSVAEYTGLIGDAMLKQGLTTQEAAEQVAMFGDVSSSTGLRLDKVAGSMQRLSGNFSKLGLTAGFGQPILEGFADSLKGMGLGFENAIELSETLSGALLKLSSNYSAAYITFQRGGLDMGGGSGALGAGIGMRAKISSQDYNQGDMALEMAGALSDTLESFTGGQIVTVQEAAADPALQATFFAQTKLLEDLYGIQDTGAQDRTLELLTQLEDATRSGNTELATSLAEQLDEARSAQSGTLSYEEKTAKFTEATFAEIQLMNRNIIKAFQISGDSLVDVVTDLQSNAVSTAEVASKDLNARSPESMSIDFKKAFESGGASVQSGLKSLSDKIDQLGIKEELSNALQNAEIKVNDIAGANATMELAKSIKALIKTLDRDNNNGRNPKTE